MADSSTLVASPSTAKPPSLPTLPTEIITRIIQLALPRVAFTTFRERYETLLRFSLVDARWRELAQWELQRHVLLSDEEARPTSLQHRLCMPATGESVRGLWLREPLPGNVQWIERDLPNVEEIYMSGFAYMPVLDLGTFVGVSANLTHLLLDFCSLVPLPAPSSMRFPVLRQVLFDHLYSDLGLEQLLDAMNSSSLESLAISFIQGCGASRDPMAREKALDARIARLGGTLRTFELVGSGDVGGRDIWTSFGALEHLIIDPEANLNLVLPKIPSLLRRITFIALPGVDSDLKRVVDALKGHPALFERVQQISVFDSDLPSDKYTSSRRQVEELCKERNIEVVVSEAVNEDDWDLYSEQIMEAAGF